MKKLFGATILGISALTLASCGNKTEVDGKVAIEYTEFRQAISSAINRDELADDVLANGSFGRGNLVPTQFVAGFDDLVTKSQETNEAKAKELLLEAQKKMVADGECEDTGKKCTVDLEILLTNSESSVNIGKKIKSDIHSVLGEENVKVTLKNVEWATLLDLKHSGDFDMVFSGWGPDYADPMSFLELWETGNGHNDAGYSNADFDAIMTKSRKAIGSTGAYATEAERLAALAKAEDMLMAAVPMVTLFQKGSTVLFSENFKSYPFRNKLGADSEYKFASLDDNKGTKLNLINSSFIPTMDSTQATDQESFSALQRTTETLFRPGPSDSAISGTVQASKDYNRNDWLIGGAADDFLTEKTKGYTGVDTTVTIDGETVDAYKYTFTISNTTPWVNSEGEDVSGTYGNVTAQDYEFAWKLLGAETTASQYAFMIDDVLGVLKDDNDEYLINAINDTTLEITVAAPIAYIESLLSFQVFAPIDKDFYDTTDGKDDYGTAADKFLYSGPFYMSSYTKKTGEFTTFEKNDHYWDKDAVSLTEISEKYVQGIENATLVQSYISGDVHVAGLTSENVATYGSRNDAKKISSATSFYVTFNIGNDGH